MRKSTLKKSALIWATCLILIAFLPIIQTGVASQNEGDNQDSIVNIDLTMDNDEIHISYDISGYLIETIEHDGMDYKRYRISGESNFKNPGCPDLPNIRRSIVIPDDKKMMVDVVSIDVSEYEGIDIIPSKGLIPRTINPDDIPYKFDEIYEQDTWYPNKVVELDTPYILRDFRSQIIQINPIQYNPFQHKIRVVNSIEVSISEDGPAEQNILYRIKPLDRLDNDFQPIYSNHFLNYKEITSGFKYTPVSDQGNMLVICYDDFYEEMMPFVEWKNMKGIPTEIVNVSSIGTTATEIDTYISDYYNTTGLTFVLLVGDIDQIPSMDTPYSSHVSDPSYAYIVGDDHYQDIFIGRFSAQNEDQVITQVNRSIEYEKNPEADADWYHKGIGIGSPEGVGDDGEYDWEHIRNLRNLLMNFTYSFVDEFYGGSQGGDDADGEPVVADVVSALNEGRTILNHCGHGAWDGVGWGAMPGWYVLHIDDINDLTNDHKLPFTVLVACNPGEFESYDACFAETCMRATNNGEPTGAIGVFASTQSQSWDPPMEAQDEIVDLLVNSTYNTMGGLTYSGTMSMVDDYGSGCYDEIDTWTLFGDPSLQIRTDTPIDMDVDHSTSVMSGETEFEVTVTGIEGALCAVSFNGHLLGYAYTDSSGNALITFNESIEDMEELDFVVTAFNTMPYITTLEVMPPLRNIAEFEPMQGVLIAYPFGISYEIIAEMSEGVIVTTIVESSSQQSTVHSLYESNGVNTANCEYLIAPSDSYWTRDYGPWFRYNSTINTLEVVDFEYNRPRPNDDNIPNVFASEYGLNYIYMDIVASGGNYMTDGYGISASTELILTENPSMTEEEIKEMFAEYLGIGTYHLYPDPLGEYIEHIDCWGKFLSPDTIMIIEVDPSHSNYAEIEAAADYFETQISSMGTPYNVVRVYCHLEEPYINSLILNDKVLVPITGGTYDNAALQAYSDAMLGYEVLGFTGSWANTDALHCRAKGIPDLDMIYIDHDPMIDQMPIDAGFEVEADLTSYVTARGIVNPQLHWKNTSIGVWNNLPMSNNEDNYFATIPNHPCGETIYYYFSVENSEGDLFYHPFIGEPDPLFFDITLVPDIWVDPNSISIIGNINELLTDILTIGNDDFAGENLDFIITCSDVGGYGWLSVGIDNGSIAPGNELNITVEANTNGLEVGHYSETLTISSDDPDTPTIMIPVDLETVYGNNVGALSVNYPVGAIPDGSYYVNATVQNYGSNDQFNVLVNCSIYEGGIGGVIIDEDFSTDPVDWTITHVDGTAWTWDSYDERMENTYGYPNAGYLDSPLLDCSGKTGISLSFWHYWRADYSSGNQDGYVYGSTDGGATFPHLIDSFHHNDPAEETAVKYYDISSWADGQAEVMIRFDIYNDNDWYWRIDDFNVSAEITGDLVYYSETLVDIPAYGPNYVEFTPAWDAIMGVYGIQITTLLDGDEFPGNDVVADVVSVEGPSLAFDPTSYDAGTMGLNETASTSFDIWNDGVGVLSYSLSESCDWIEIDPVSGDSTGEHDQVTVDINTTGLALGSHHCDILINSDGGSEMFGVDVYVVSSSTEIMDVNQSMYERGFPIRHAADGDWAGAQNFTPTLGMISSVDLRLRKFGTPEFDLTVELRQDAPDGVLIDSIVFGVGDVSATWDWFHVDFDDCPVISDVDYFVVIPPAPSGVTTSFGYEWAYEIDDVYDGGSFWFTRDGGGLWRDLPDNYEFAFRTYGLM
jgi:agmatine/peptidylarginine deiminase